MMCVKIILKLVLFFAMLIPSANAALNGETLCFRAEHLSIMFYSKNSGYNEHGQEDWSCGFVAEALVKEYKFYTKHQDESDCRKLVNTWQKLLNKSKYFCVTGIFMSSYHAVEPLEVKMEERIYEKLVTDLGCDSFSGEDCKGSERIRR